MPPRARKPKPAVKAGPLAEAPHGSRPEQAYARLRTLIVDGTLAPGARIVETEIATRLGVSRTPVREALQRLQQEGFVSGTPGAQQARLSVAPLTRADVHELLDVVGVLEGLGARRAAALPAPAREALAIELRSLNQDFARAATALPVNHGKLYEADERLHGRIVQAGGGPRLQTLHDAVKPQAERYIRMYIRMLSGDTRPSTSEHDAIIDAIAAGRPAEAQRAVELNWRHAAERLAKVIGTAPAQ